MSSADQSPPVIVGLEVRPAGDCLRVRLETSEPATVTASLLTPGGGRDDHLLARGASLFDVAFRPARAGPVSGVGGDIDGRTLASATLEVTAVDGQGNRALADPVAVDLPAPGGTLAITELLVNPAGAETTQEWVEVANRGATSTSLDGLAIADDGGMDPLPAGITLAPGARVLIVADTFDEGGGADVAPRPGTPLVRVTGRIGRDGLRQGGEVVRLIDLAAGGHLRSSYGGWVDTTGTAWSGGSVQRIPDEGACDHPAAWSTAPQRPTPGW